MIYPDAVCANNKVRGHHLPVFKSNGAGLVINALAAGWDVSVFDIQDGWVSSHVINDDLAGNTLAFLRSRGVKKNLVHVLAVEHVVYVTPSGFIVVQVILVEYAASLPVAHDELLKDDGFHHWDVDPPLSEPLSTLSKMGHGILSVEHR